MYPLTIGLAIENRDLWEQAQACLADLPFRIIVEHQDIGDLSNFLDRLERMRPDVVLVDISLLGARVDCDLGAVGRSRNHTPFGSRSASESTTARWVCPFPPARA